jgi:hypothetical protein
MTMARMSFGRQVLAADLHRRGAEAVLGEHAADRRAFVEQHDGQVLAVGLAHARFGHADAHAGHREQGGGIRGGQVHGHEGFSSEVSGSAELAVALLVLLAAAAGARVVAADARKGRAVRR